MIGAKYGIDMRETGDSATYVSITLVNQVRFLLKMMDFILKMVDFTLKMMDFVLY